MRTDGRRGPARSGGRRGVPGRLTLLGWWPVAALCVAVLVGGLTATTALVAERLPVPGSTPGWRTAPASAGVATGGGAGGAAGAPVATPTPAPTRASSVPASPVPRVGAGRPSSRTGGRPGPANTGVPAGTRLRVVEGDQVVTRNGTVLSGLDIHGFLRIRARNVTVRNSVVRGGSPRCNSAVVDVEAGASALIEDSEVAPSSPSPCLDGIWATATTLLRVNVHGTVDGVKAFDNTTVQDSWIHDLSWFDNDPNAGGPTHNDAVQTYEGNRHVLLRHNTLTVGPRGNAAYQVTQDGGRVSTDLRVQDNWLDGGGCTLNFSHQGGPAPMTGIRVTGNRFGRGSVYRCPVLISTGTVLTEYSGNVWDDTGVPVPPPQQHD